MTYNTCGHCGANEGRAGLLISEGRDGVSMCLNCRDTKKTGDVVLHAHLHRTKAEVAKTMELVVSDDNKLPEFQSIGRAFRLNDLTDPKTISVDRLEAGLEELIEQRQLKADILESFRHNSLVDVVDKFGDKADAATIGELYAQHVAERMTSVQPIHKDETLRRELSDWMLENDFDYGK